MHILQTHTSTLCTIYKQPETANKGWQQRKTTAWEKKTWQVLFRKDREMHILSTYSLSVSVSLSHTHTHMSNKVQLVELVLYKLIKTKPPYALWPGRRMLCDLAVVCFAHKRCRILCAEGRRMLCVIARRGPLWVVSGSRLAMTQSIRRPSAQNMRQLCAQKPLHNMNIQFHWQILRENTQQRRSFQCVETGLHFGRFRLSMPSFKFGKLQHLF